MRLSRLMVRILAQDDHFYLLKRGKVERIENIISRRVNRVGFVLRSHRLKQFFIIIFGEFSFQGIGPASAKRRHIVFYLLLQADRHITACQIFFDFTNFQFFVVEQGCGEGCIGFSFG